MDNALVAERFKGFDEPAPVSLAAGQVGGIMPIVLEVGQSGRVEVAGICLNVSEEVKRRVVGNLRRKKINWFRSRGRLHWTCASFGRGKAWRRGPSPDSFHLGGSVLSLTFL